MVEPGIAKERAAELLSEKFGTPASDLQYFRFPKGYGSTSGPFGGVGGQVITSFTLEAWASEYGPAVVFCGKKIIAITQNLIVQGSWEGDQT